MNEKKDLETTDTLTETLEIARNEIKSPLRNDLLNQL